MLLLPLMLWLCWKLLGNWTLMVPVLFSLPGAIVLYIGRFSLRTRVLIVLVMVAIVSFVWGRILAGPGSYSDLLIGLGTDLAGAIVTYLLIDRLVGEKERVKNLIAQMGSGDHGVALAAAEELTRRGHLRDGSLKGANLNRANLSGALFVAADLREALLFDSDLSGANLFSSNLHGAILVNANLGRAKLQNTNLNTAKLMNANLSTADLTGAKLIGADLRWADLTGACLMYSDLSGANLDEALLPDGSKGTTSTDMGRFTNPSHPGYRIPFGV